MQTWKAEIELTVSDTWVQDGFNLDNEHLQEMLKEMLEKRLPYSYHHETKTACNITKAPKPETIEGLQNGKLEPVS